MNVNLLAAARRLASPADPTDAELLDRFARARDEAAFRALVERHGPMVLAACRRVLGCPHDADDAFQAAFLVLARRAGAVRVRSLGDWLHGVARRTAVAARRAAARRRAREAGAEPASPTPAADVAELRAVLDEELAALPAKYREVLVLADLEEKDRRAVAAELGVPEGTVASRHARARALLAKRLTRRGWGLPGYLAAVAPAMVPPTLAAAAAGRAVVFVTGITGSPASASEALAREVIGAMVRKKLAAVAVLVAVVGGGVAGLSAAGPGDGVPASSQKPGPYSVATAGGTTLLVDAGTGDTWVLSPGKEPTWVPVHKGTPAPKEKAAPAARPADKADTPPAKGGLEATARLVPARSARVAAPAPGVVARVLVREGDWVKPGQVLAELGDTEARLEVEGAKVELIRARAGLETLRAAAKAGTVTSGERDRAEADAKAAEVKVALAEVRLAATRVTAPFDGAVVRVGVAPGEAVGGPGSAAVAEVATLSDIQAAFEVAELDAARVSVGQPCTVRVWAGGAEYEGVVVAVGAVIDPATATVAVRARLKLPDSKPAPRPGSVATVRLTEKK